MDTFLASSSFVMALLEESFFRYALYAGVILGFITPIIGSFVVIRRLSFIADTLSHFSLAGLSIGLFLMQSIGVLFIADPIYLAMVFSVIGALIIEVLRGYYQNYKEISMPIVMSLGTALSVLFISLNDGFNSSILNYLFGDILSISSNYLIIIIVVTIVTLLLLALFYKEMVIISFDEAYARLLGIKVGIFQFVSTLILAFIVSLSIATVGVLLVSSLMIIPVAAAMKVGKSFKNTVVIAIIFSEISVIGGLWLSFEFRIASSAPIVLINILFLVLVGIFRKINNAKRLKNAQSELIE